MENNIYIFKSRKGTYVRPQSTRKALYKGKSPCSSLVRGKITCNTNFKCLILNTVLENRYRCSEKGQNKVKLTRQLDKREKTRNTFARFLNFSNYNKCCHKQRVVLTTFSLVCICYLSENKP